MPYSIPLEVNMPSYKCLHGRNYIVDNKSVAPTKKKMKQPLVEGRRGISVSDNYEKYRRQNKN